MSDAAKVTEDPEDPAETPIDEPDSSPPALALAALLIFIGIGAVWVNLQPSVDLKAIRASVDLAPPSWAPTAAERAALESLADARRAQPAKAESVLGKRLRIAFERLNRLSLLPGATRASRAFQDAHADTKQRAHDFLLREGRPSFLALGQWVSDQLMTALEAQDGPQIEALAGGVFRAARASHLITPSHGLGSDARRVLPLVVMAWWVQIVASSHRVAGWLPPLERDVLRRWKLAKQHLPARRRAALMKELRALASPYPGEWAMAAHAAEAHDWIGAVAFYELALARDPSNGTLRAALAYAQKHVARNRTPP